MIYQLIILPALLWLMPLQEAIAEPVMGSFLPLATTAVQPVPDLNAMANALIFLGVCSVICALIWGSSILRASQNRRAKHSTGKES